MTAPQTVSPYVEPAFEPKRPVVGAGGALCPVAPPRRAPITGFMVPGTALAAPARSDRPFWRAGRAGPGIARWSAGRWKHCLRRTLLTNAQLLPPACSLGASPRDLRSCGSGSFGARSERHQVGRADRPAPPASGMTPRLTHREHRCRHYADRDSTHCAYAPTRRTSKVGWRLCPLSAPSSLADETDLR